MRLPWPRMIFQGAETEKPGEGPALRTSLLKIPTRTGAVQCFPAVEPGKGDFFLRTPPTPAGRANPQPIPGLSLNRILPALHFLHRSARITWPPNSLMSKGVERDYRGSVLLLPQRADLR